MLHRKARLVVIVSCIFSFVYGAYHPDDLYYSIAFIKNIVKHHEVGALAPSSSFLAHEITKPIQEHTVATQPVYVLEVGAGTGVFTQKIIDILEDKKVPYILDVIEINKDYVDILKKRFSEYTAVTVHECSVLDWHPSYRYDHIVSGLPFTVMPSDVVIDIVDYYEKVVKPHGTISYFEYILTASLKRMTLFGDHKKEFIKKREHLKNFRQKWHTRTKKVYRNIPPAYVHHLSRS